MRERIETSLFVEIMRETVERMEAHPEQQAFNQLRVNDHFCALGVACDVLASKMPNRYRWEEFPDIEGGYLFYETGNYAGVAISSPGGQSDLFDKDEGMFEWVVSDNDSGAYTFPELAQKIRDYFIEEKGITL